MAEASLQPIYERLNGADSYHPFSANTFADWSIEAGDIVTLKRRSDAYVSPVHSSHLSWRGSPQMTMQSRGSRELDSIGKATQKKFNRSNGGYRAAREIGKKASVFLQHGDPSLQIDFDADGDYVWIDYAGLDTINDVGELSWDELADYTWMDFYGSKMYSWNGSSWVEISDQQKEEYNFELLQNTVTELRSVKGDLAGAYSEIKQTKNELNATVKNARDGLEWNLSVTAGELRSEMSNKETELRSSISQQADRISLVVEGTGNNAHIKPASIVAAINAQTGQSTIFLDANKIKIGSDSGTTVDLADAIGINDGYVEMKKGVLFDNSAIFGNGKTIAIQGDAGGGTIGTISISYANMKSAIKSASVSADGTTLTLTPFTGTAINFSKPSPSPYISNNGNYIWTSSSIPSGATNLSRLVTQFRLAEDDGDNLIIKVQAGDKTHVYYCTP